MAELRRRMGMTQEQFASRFGFSVATLRHWERGDRKPAGAALVLLNVIEHDPKGVPRVHHTGRMGDAIALLCDNVRPGGE